jgi:hypothetical protein
MAILMLVSFLIITVRVVSAGWTNTDFQTILHCTTQYASEGNASSVDTDWLTTDTQTTTEWLYFTKTELYTPRASTTTLSEIATSYERLTIDEWTSIITTATKTSSLTVEIVATVTDAATTTTALKTEYSNATKSDSCSPSALGTHFKDKDDWEVADVYWTTESESSETQNQTSPTKPAGAPVKLDCTLTTQSNNFWATTSIKQSGPTPTYTRTAFVGTETSTLIARTRRNKYDTPPTSTETWKWSDVTWITVYQTSTIVATVTVRISSIYRYNWLILQRRQRLSPLQLPCLDRVITMKESSTNFTALVFPGLIPETSLRFSIIISTTTTASLINLDRIAAKKLLETKELLHGINSHIWAAASSLGSTAPARMIRWKVVTKSQRGCTTILRQDPRMLRTGRLVVGNVATSTL